MIKTKVENEFNTIRDILKRNASIARFGDGELRVCVGGKIKSQCFDPQLQIRLLDILGGYQENLLIGIPRTWKRKDYPAKAHWDRFMGRSDIEKLFDSERLYYSAFISRMECAPILNMKTYWELVKMIWADRDIVIVEGRERQFTRSCRETDLINRISSVYSVMGPDKNAFRHRKVLISQINAYPKDFLILLSLGATATILAHDLTEMGYQALDVGRLAIHHKRVMSN